MKFYGWNIDQNATIQRTMESKLGNIESNQKSSLILLTNCNELTTKNDEDVSSISGTQNNFLNVQKVDRISGKMAK